MRPKRPRVTLVSPALKAANNGNWQTAYRWSRFLRNDCRVTLAARWPDDPRAPSPPDCLIALHARRSADSIAAFARAFPARPLVVVLTGTDLYQDIRNDTAAQRSLELATHLVVLQEEGMPELAAAHRDKCRVIYQSAARLKPAQSNATWFDVVLVGHMRAVKDPLTPMRALALLPEASRVRLIHIGAALEPHYLLAARKLQKTNARYRWLGALPHAQTRQRIKRARLMVISSLMEGGANVVIEAVTAGVPVLASAVSGNEGMLGRDYAGYFPLGDTRALAALLDRAEREPRFLAQLKRQCRQRAALFAPERERRAVVKLVKDALSQWPMTT